ncbi:RPII140-upstream gene protein [Acyrthosiphon pisum]|uniref:Complex I assembly factor TIMMDC1, mitochondrial n=1 Tax=Acyrthosiphon pisum TaxID=7029 RepID=A0A8R2A1I9_ACYPI|nr:RPII140-upstream gene protein [Acyrthosiphon pisum]|eukprot:XP_001948378.1 PREDICTED: RPII140-upstream gene protein [Acyrthosiphon pisum]
MFFRRLKLSHTRCFLPAFFLNKNEHDVDGTEVLDTKKVRGWQGVVNAFSTDEDGNPSPDVRAIFSTVCYSSLMGGVYGSLSYSKRAYEDFFHKNQSTLFQNQFEAKAKLQSQVTLAMARGVFKWGTRVALFCGTFTTIVTAVNAYTQKVTVISYATAGFVVGGIARISFGMKGFLVGSTLGAILGVIAGSCTLLILKFSSYTMDEVKEWQSQSQIERDLYFVKEQKTSRIFKYDKPPELEEHEKRIQQSGIHEQFQNKE